jgi:hypothetical protein
VIALWDIAEVWHLARDEALILTRAVIINLACKILQVRRARYCTPHQRDPRRDQSLHYLLEEL